MNNLTILLRFACQTEACPRSSDIGRQDQVHLVRLAPVPPNHTRFYADGPDWPQSPEQQAAERAYRDAFLAAAREAGQG